jgi:DNA-binding transcriptional ArsR family regulator
MPRAATTADVFNAIAEPRRRQIIDLLARRAAAGGLAVGALVLALGIPQPAVSKHLGVLRKVGLVTATAHGQHRLYRLQPAQLRHVHDWVSAFERLWSHQLDRIKQRAERRTRQRSGHTIHPSFRKGTSS